MHFAKVSEIQYKLYCTILVTRFVRQNASESLRLHLLFYSSTLFYPMINTTIHHQQETKIIDEVAKKIYFLKGRPNTTASFSFSCCLFPAPGLATLALIRSRLIPASSVLPI